jgi:uncharacterized tellurite resistance protein B-like protein
MRGFFEYQYLKFKKNHMRQLVAMAKSDGFVHPTEMDLLFKVGHNIGLKEWQVKSILESDEVHEVEIPKTHEQRMSQLYDLVKMMLADGIIEEREMEFCEMMFEKMGYDKSMIQTLIKFYDSLDQDDDSWNRILEEAKKSVLIK